MGNRSFWAEIPADASPPRRPVDHWPGSFGHQIKIKIRIKIKSKKGSTPFPDSYFRLNLMSRHRVIDFADVPPVDCPCGTARRALADVEELPATIHLTDISIDAQSHYHLDHAETYFIVSCGDDAQMELDGELIPLKPGMLVYIPPKVRHRAVGEMQILNIVIPKFDPADEHL